MNCRYHDAPVQSVQMDANRSIVGNHPLAIVRYSCGHWEFVKHSELTP